jgi:hypothetical protein
MTGMTSVGQAQELQEAFEIAIDEDAIKKLSTEELEAIHKMLTEAGY